MEVCLRFFGREGAPEIKAIIPDYNITVGAMVSIILQHNNPSGITACQVKIICGGALLKHSSTLADCHFCLHKFPIFYTYPEPLVPPTFLNFSACQTVDEALQAIADAAASATSSFSPFSMRDSLFETPLHHACMRFKDAAPVRSLIAAGLDVNAINCNGFPPLFFAKSLEVVQELLRAKADPNFEVKGQTPLHRAVSGDIVDILIANGCILNYEIDANPLAKAKEASSFTPLHAAASRNDDVVLRLIHHNADVNAREAMGKTPLHFAVDVHIAESLLSAKAIIDARDNGGFTALHFAHSADLARWFLRQGLKADADQSDIRSPIETVLEFETAVVLYEAGESFHQNFLQLDLQKGEATDSSVIAAREIRVKRYREFQQFNAELSLTALCRGAAFAAAFGRRALYSSHPPVVSQPCWSILCGSGSRLCGAFACTGGSFMPEDDQGEVGLAGGTARVLHEGICSDTRRSFAAFRISNCLYLRCIAAGGMSGLVARRLFENSQGIVIPQLHSLYIIRYAASSLFAMALHSERR
jgi:ankyrin repeat protein